MNQQILIPTGQSVKPELLTIHAAFNKRTNKRMKTLN